MSFVDHKKIMATDNPNFFKVGDVVLFVSANNIEISRHENFQAVSYLRDSHAMKIHTGRSTLRVNISFPVLVDQQMAQLQALVAMTRVTPFVPIQNKFIQAQLKIYDTAADTFELNKSPDTKSLTKIEHTLAGDAYTSEGEPTFLEALPMAIMGMSVTMGGDSPEIAECAMSLIYWNPMPWFGIDLQYWKEDTLGGLQADYARYIQKKVLDRAPGTFDTTVFRWWDVKLFSELKERFAKEIAEAEANAPAPKTSPVDEQKKAQSIRTDEDGRANFDDFNNYLKFKSKRTSVDDLVEGIANAETKSFSQNAGWDKVNPNTQAAGRYQMSPNTFKGLFNEGNDVPGGVPLRERVRDELQGSPALNSRTLNSLINSNSPDNHVAGDRDTFAIWYAQPEMADLQTFVTTEYVKGLYEKHDGDAVKAALEYFLGARDAKPYITHWDKYGTIKDWSKKDEKKLGSINQNPIVYIHNIFGKFTAKHGGYSVDGTDPILDSLSFEEGGSGPVPRNRKGDVLGAGIEPVISQAVHDKLRELGWEQVATRGDGRPATHIINPLFARTEPNIIDLAAGGVMDPENQVVTSISISFQNRFASMPVQGWPYPTLQHMGSIDSELRMTVACLSDSQQYNRMKQAQSMLHIMAARARRYYSDVHDAREILLLSRLACSNQLINALGINDVVMTDLQIQIDPESTNMARGEFIMSESAFDPNKEKLTTTLGKNDRRFRVGLREDWLAGEKYLHSKNSSVINMGVRLRKLQQQNDAALASNLDILYESGQLEKMVADAFTDDDDFRSMVVFTREDTAHYRKQQSELTDFKNLNGVKGLNMSSALYVAPTARVLNMFENVKASEFDKQDHVVVPINPDLLLTESLGTKVGDWLEGLYKVNKVIPGNPLELDRIKGSASKLLATSFGIDMVEVWQRLKNQPTADEFSRDIAQFFVLWAKAYHEWYNREILEAMLLFLYHRNESDSTFTELVARSRDIPGTGIYKDLMLDRLPTVNPYEWLDRSIEPKLLGAMEDVVNKTEKNTAVLLKEYNARLRDRDGAVRFKPNDVTAHAVVRDATNDSRKDKQAGEQAYRSGLSAALSRVGVDAANAASSLRDFSAVNFTMRRAFPAYRMYFIEEDNQGIIKRFDDFYNYNAITDIQMVKYKYRPTTMIITMTNLFGHLDAKTFSDMADKEELADAIRANANGGTLPSQVTESGPNGEEETVEADGSVGPLREIMLKPGTKIVMKLGYENNPDNLPTTFAGQVTEVSGGSILTIVCQDWMSEMFAGITKDDGIDTSGGLWNWAKYVANASSSRDLQNTASVRATIGSVMKQRSLMHFGHWQLDKKHRDPNFFGYRRESSFIEKPFDNVFTDLLTMFSGDQLEGTSRALINIHPQTQPFYGVFGIDTESVFPTADDLYGMNLWELVEMQRRLMPNHLALVRPYGQGDATLYFGPPWGVYVADEFDGEINTALSDDILSVHNRDVFRNMIKHNATITVSGLGRINETWRQRLLRDVGARFGIAKNDTLEIPIAVALQIFSDVLFEEANSSRMTGALVGAVVGAIAHLYNPVSGALTGAVGGATHDKNIDGQPRAERNNYDLLHSGSPNSVIDKWYDLLMETLRGGGIHDDEDAHSVLINIQSKIRKTQQAMAWLRSRDDAGFDPSGSVRKALKPVRRWHIATARHHIIANNIQVNSNFANEVRAGDTVVRYDPELTERRTRFADREIPEGANDDPSKSLYMTSLLADEMRTMYRGQLVLTGNAEIEPHDIIMIFDETRHMRGAIEAAKVTHIFNQEMGFITIVEPHLIVEQGDYSLSTALAAFFTSLVDDVQENEETAAGKGTNRALAGGAIVGYAALRGFLGPLTGLGANYIITQMLVADDARNHPLTIYPLVKRDAPWIGGIEGASGRGVIGVIGGKVIKTLKNVRKFVRAISDRIDEVEDAAKVIPRALDTSGASGKS